MQGNKKTPLPGAALGRQEEIPMADATVEQLQIPPSRATRTLLHHRTSGNPECRKPRQTFLTKFNPAAAQVQKKPTDGCDDPGSHRIISGPNFEPAWRSKIQRFSICGKRNSDHEAGQEIGPRTPQNFHKKTKPANKKNWFWVPFLGKPSPSAAPSSAHFRCGTFHV